MDAWKRVIALAAPEAHGGHSHAPAAEGRGAEFPPTFRRFVREMDVGMDRMMKDMHAPGYTGNADVDFLAMMIPHHEGAVEMARLVLVHGKDPLTRQLADEIIASQTAEIAAMRQRLAILRRGDDPEPGGFPALQGTRGGAPR
jgi:hypothetical protein